MRHHTVRRARRLSAACAAVAVMLPVAGPAAAQSAQPAAKATQCKRWHLDSPRRTGAPAALWAVTKRNLVAVGDKGTILRSSNSGDTWRAVASPTHRRLSAVAGHGRRGYAVGDFGTVVHTRDSGRTWTAGRIPRPEHLTQVSVTCGTTVLALGASRLHRSTNGAKSWTSRAFPSSGGGRASARLDKLVTTHGGVVLVTGSGAGWPGGGAWRSTDCGKTFRPTRITPRGENVVALAASPSGTLHAFGGSRTVARSKMACGSCIDKTATELVAYRSSDGGATWKRTLLRHQPMMQVMSPGGHHPPIKQGYWPVLSARAVGSSVYLLDGHDLFVSANQGRSWTRRPSTQPRLGYSLTLTSSPGRLWLLSRPRYRHTALRAAVSTDGGRSFTGKLVAQPYRGIHGGKLMTAGWASAQGNVMVVGTKGRIASRPRGASWVRHDRTPATDFTAAWGSGPLRLAVGTGGAIHRSTDSGRTFQRVASGTTEHLYAIWARTPRDLFVTGKSVLLRSRDSGRTWTRRRIPKRSRFISVWGSGKRLYVRGVFPHALLTSSDAGRTWTDLSRGLGTNFTHIRGVSATELYAFGRAGRLARTTDGGRTWTRLAVRGPGHASYWTADITDLWADGKRIYMVIGGALASSQDRGRTWRLESSPFGFRISHVHHTTADELLAVGWDGDAARLDLRCKP